MNIFIGFICLYLLGWVYCCIKVDELYFKHNKESLTLMWISLIHYIIFFFTWYIEFIHSLRDYKQWEEKWQKKANKLRI
jgi:hypothetical protein